MLEHERIWISVFRMGRGGIISTIGTASQFAQLKSYLAVKRNVGCRTHVTENNEERMLLRVALII
jgi:hypothetical protein